MVEALGRWNSERIALGLLPIDENSGGFAKHTLFLTKKRKRWTSHSLTHDLLTH